MKTIRSSVKVATSPEGIVHVNLITSMDVWTRLQTKFSGSTKLETIVIPSHCPIIQEGHVCFIMPEHFNDKNYLGIRDTKHTISLTQICDINIWYDSIQNSEVAFKRIREHSDERTVRNSVLVGCTAIKVNIHGVIEDFLDLLPEIKTSAIRPVFLALINK